MRQVLAFVWSFVERYRAARRPTTGAAALLDDDLDDWRRLPPDQPADDERMRFERLRIRRERA